MSARTTPRRPSATPLSPNSSSSSIGWSPVPSRRGTRSRTSTTLGGSAPSYVRRPSTLSAVHPPSTPSTISNVRRKYEPSNDSDWAGMEPDEVFRRLPVSEVKRVEAKMRADALNKQSELRSMVGTRYRDLLTSASQITALHDSSLRLSASLRTVSGACANPTELASGEMVPEQSSEGEDIAATLPVAAHMKLLIDTPEALYSYLAHHDYLSAAFLWLVARVAKDSLTEMPESVNGPYLPLLEKQWATLLPFRQQIVQRATSALRSRHKVDTKTGSDTLLAIVLLDEISLSEALDLLLHQRLQAVKEFLHPPSTKRQRRMSRAAEARHSAEDTTKAISDAVHVLLDAVTLAQSIFEKRFSARQSVLAESIRLVQVKEDVPVVQTQPVATLGHHRRASRLASISLPLPPRAALGTNGDAPPVSAVRVIQSLPFSQILLRYLPQGITGFTPTLPPATAPGTKDKLGPWQALAVDVLRDSVPAWISQLTAVHDVWAVRRSLRESLSDEDAFEAQLASALEAEWRARVQDIWTTKLDTIVTSLSDALDKSASRVRAGEDAAGMDNDSERYMFSAIQFPAVSASGGSGTGTGTEAFLSSLKKRAAFRTPLLDGVMNLLESEAEDIRTDLVGLPQGLYEDYREKLKSALHALVKVLDGVLADVGGHRDATGSVEAELFVGRIALYLVHCSPFLPDLVGGTDVDLSAIKSALMETHASSLVQWQGRSVAQATGLLKTALSQASPATGAELPSRASDAMTSALLSLSGDVKRLGVPPGVDLGVVESLLKAFVEKAGALDWAAVGSEKQAAGQAAFDLAFLLRLSGRPSSELAEDKVVAQLLGKAQPDLKAQLGQLVEEHLRRTQLILAPLTRHLPSVAPQGRERNAALLRLGAPALGRASGTEFRSPIPVAKPGKRFGLLSIVA